MNCLKCKFLDVENGGCLAFPNGIPFEITEGIIEHDKVIQGQVGEYVFEEENEEQENQDSEE